MSTETRPEKHTVKVDAETAARRTAATKAMWDRVFAAHARAVGRKGR